MLPQITKILLVEDNPGDVILFKRFLSQVDEITCECSFANRLDEAVEFLKSNPVDVVMLDLALPDSHGLDTVQRIRNVSPSSAVIVLTGLEDDAAGLEAVRAGAQDYLIKGQINRALLLRAIRYAIERSRLLRELEDAAAQIKTLSGMLPICSTCKKVRDDQGYWDQVDVYVAKNTDAVFSHGICPDCSANMLAEFRKLKG